jgi:acyl-CoA reductase-like NAD-dependent aldehyde dehydrogenase
MAKRTPPQARNANGHASAKSLVIPSDRVTAPSDEPERLPVLKTYKLYIGGKFPRTESGRYDVIKDAKGKPLANICRASKKDFRDAVVAARAAQSGWAKRSAYNRAQILYRIAEMLEGRTSQFVEELAALGMTLAAAKREVQATVDRFVYYAGWCDKYSQVFSSVNPVASSHFNFSLHEPTGLVAIVAPDAAPLLALATLVAATIAGGNSVIILASETNPLPSITFAEVLATSDLPGGVVNVLTGQRAELVEHFSSHMDVNAVIYAAADRELLKKIQTLSANNVKRVIVPKIVDYFTDKAESPYLILDTQEVKTTWHPVGM